ncbi:glycosyltransferase family 4 protein [Amnibacterium soli]|uniref:Glycosyltransferase family 4 protein n=2 Tax=Amnibacterium soli TaxID=1282736 RepID=A0ABP8ZD74_9MICO
MAERLIADGEDVRVLTAFPHYPEWRFEAAPPRSTSLVVRGVRVRRLRHRLPRGGSSASRLISELSFGLRALTARWGRPDAVVLVSPALFACLVVAPRLLLTRTPFVVWVQDLYGLGIRETSGDGRLARSVSRIESWLLRRADQVVVISDGMAQVTQSLGVHPDRISVVRNWTHIDSTPLADRAGYRAALGWGEDETVVLHTGAMGTKQDLGNVVEAARLADAATAPVRFVLMGDGMDRKHIEQLAEGVSRLEVLPPAPSDRYHRMLQAADVLLVNEHPGLRGMALPSKLTSYFTSGRPIVAATNAQSATAGEIRRSMAGVQVDAGVPSSLLAAVRALVRDLDLMSELGASGGRYYRSSLTLDGAARSFERVLAALPVAAERLPVPASVSASIDAVAAREIVVEPVQVVR